MLVLTNLLIAIALLLTAIRLIRGPTVWDRLLGYNSISNKIVTLLAIHAVFRGMHIYMDVALIYALLSFLGVVVIARFAERGGGKR